MRGNYQQFIQKMLRDTSKIAMQYFGKVTGTTKPGNNNQVLTKADLEVSTFLIKKIEEMYPTHNIIDEEKGVIDKKSEYTWVIDPIDGTSNFASGLPYYGVMLGLLQNNTPIAGGVSLPFFKEEYIAETGSGAYCNGRKIQVSQEKDLLSVLVAYGIDGRQNNPQQSHDEGKLIGELVLHIRNLRGTGSVFDTMMVANGKYGAFLSQAGRVWDNVAQHIIIEEAGGVYTDFFGKPMNYKNHLQRAKETFTWCAAAPQLHKQIQAIIHFAE